MLVIHKATRKKFKQAEPIRLDISPFRMRGGKQTKVEKARLEATAKEYKMNLGNQSSPVRRHEPHAFARWAARASP